MDKLVKVACLVSLAYVLCGFAYKQYKTYKVEDVKYETVYYHEVFRKGDTFEGIVKHYFNKKNEGCELAEWLYKEKMRNKRLFYKVDGSPKPQVPGDIVCIEVRERVK